MLREDIILPYVKDKHVLDCGSVDHYFHAEKRQNGEWLHASIARHAKSCLGVDILADRIADINRLGTYRFVDANVENLPFDREFDVIVAGELIEHVYNAGLFIDSAWRALRDDGILIITTPNYHAFSTVWSSVIRGKEICHEEHTCYYSKQTLEYLIHRHGFTPIRFHIVKRRARTRLRQCVRDIMHRMRPCLGEQLVLVAKKQSRQDKYSGKW
ncbi:MAG: class I SAM-dependent methyltransferase [Pirellulaceae bacterium]